MTLIAILITILYVVLVGSLIYGFDKVKDFSLKDLKPLTKFSIIIPFRNEARNLEVLLNSISKLNYPNQLFEIIFVDDESEDESRKVLETSQLYLDAQTNIIIINNKRTSKSPKKDAITLAISQAKYDWIVTTDADCIVSKYWLDSFDEFIQTHHPEFIIAPITYSKISTFLQRFQLLDVLSLQGSTIGAFGIGKPFLCNGGNLAYTKQLFNQVKGFEGNTDIASGDDIFMLEKVVKSQTAKVQFLKCEQVIVTTSPQLSLKALVSQRIRWAAKASAYHNWYSKFAGIAVFLMNGGLMVFALLTLIGILKIKVLLYIIIIKFGMDFLLIYKTSIFMNQKEVMKSYFLAFFIYPIFSTYIAISSVLKGYKWKGRDYIK